MSRYACPLVSLQYSVLDPDTLKRLHRSKNQQIEMERLANKVTVLDCQAGWWLMIINKLFLLSLFFCI